MKRKTINWRRSLLLGCGMSLCAGAALADGWEQVAVPDALSVTLADGSQRDLQPSCSGGPQLANPALGLAPGNVVAAETDFSYFVQMGNPNRVLFFLDGGGACWNAETCIGSPLFSDSTYTQTVDETPEALENAGGVLDGDNDSNPYANYTKVFVPYCSGDIHYGSRDTLYTLRTGFGDIPWPIRHRGTDNLLAVMATLRDQGGVDLANAKEVSVAGVSAGGYGATLAFGYVAEDAPEAQLNLISDAAIGVQTADFYREAIYNPTNPGSESWGVSANLPPWVPGFADPDAFLSASVNQPLIFQPLLFGALADYRPDARLASVTTNLDSVQVAFYSLTRPGVPLPQVAGEWYFAMAGITTATAANGNYRFFIEGGNFHTFLTADDRLYGSGVNGISLAEWIDAMIKPGNRAWDNLDAGRPF